MTSHSTGGPLAVASVRPSRLNARSAGLPAATAPKGLGACGIGDVHQQQIGLPRRCGVAVGARDGEHVPVEGQRVGRTHFAQVCQPLGPGIRAHVSG
ncbi:hypothetical protein [Saccharopolyspora pogona]|uniref:hypothetical protein n=1 Tax=Saccharopolyspora pogona TaxID=333966 RepID=UPI001683761B|nr:hypothetical protein [Saccharopolyspora pogona]